MRVFFRAFSLVFLVNRVLFLVISWFFLVFSWGFLGEKGFLCVLGFLDGSAPSFFSLLI